MRPHQFSISSFNAARALLAELSGAGRGGRGGDPGAVRRDGAERDVRGPHEVGEPGGGGGGLRRGGGAGRGAGCPSRDVRRCCCTHRRC